MRNVTTELAKRSETRKKSITRRLMACTMSAAMAATITGTYAMAAYNNNTSITGASNIINLLLSITKYAGIGLAVFGAYELAMSFLQNQPEAKTKGIIMLIAGVIMFGAPTILTTIGIS